MDKLENIKVNGIDGVMRVDLYIGLVRPEMTRTTAKKLIMDGIIKVNNEQVRSNYKVSIGDIITIDNNKVSSTIDSMSLTSIKPTKMNIDIIFEDKDLIAVNKPTGVVVHPVQGHWTDSLLNGLLFYYQNRSDSETLQRIRPIHRLDRDTSGVVIFSKNKESHEFYSKQFEKHQLEKVYFAVVSGDFQEYHYKKNKEVIDISTYIARSNKDRKSYENTTSEKGQPALTKVQFVRFWKHPHHKNEVYSLVKVVPQTGRTHQIRVHLSGIGFPILGDILYSQTRYKRLMLHASELNLKQFRSQENKPLRLSSKLPKEFAHG